MENLQPEAANASGGIVAPKIAPAASLPPFTASKKEVVAASLTYALAYLYIRMYGQMLDGQASSAAARVLLAAFTLGFLALTEYLHRDTPRSRESHVWFGCALLILVSLLARRGRAWDEGLPFVFLHIFAVWWALCRSGTLLEGASGRMLPLDALDAFFAFPLKHFFLRARTMGFCCSRACEERKRETGDDDGSIGWTLLIVAAALGLLALAMSLLGRADAGFSSLLSGFTELLRFDWDVTSLVSFLLRVLLSLPVGAYLFGLLGGTLREDRDALRARVSNADETLGLLRGVPEKVWLVLLSAFCALYALFFAVQGRYLFGAFTRTLPDGFVVAEYARRGFFELCKVMAVNFALLYLVSRTSKKGVRGRRAASALCLVLLTESLLLAVVALSKLWLYIDCFGFTPRRLQSTYLACVLAFGALCAAWSLIKGTKTFRVWMYFGAVTLSLLCLY